MGKPKIQLHRWHILDTNIRSGQASRIGARTAGGIRENMRTLTGSQGHQPLRIELGSNEPISPGLLDTLNRQAAHHGRTGLIRVQRGSGNTGRSILVRLHDTLGPRWGFEPNSNKWRKSLPALAHTLITNTALNARLQSERVVIGVPHHGQPVPRSMAEGALAMMNAFSAAGYQSVELTTLLDDPLTLATLNSGTVQYAKAVSTLLPNADDETDDTRTSSGVTIPRTLLGIPSERTPYKSAEDFRSVEEVRRGGTVALWMRDQALALRTASSWLDAPSIASIGITGTQMALPMLDEFCANTRWWGKVEIRAAWEPNRTAGRTVVWFSEQGQRASRIDFYGSYQSASILFNVARHHLTMFGQRGAFDLPPMVMFLSGQKDPHRLSIPDMLSICSNPHFATPHCSIFWNERSFDLHQRQITLA